MYSATLACAKVRKVIQKVADQQKQERDRTQGGRRPREPFSLSLFCCFHILLGTLLPHFPEAKYHMG